MEAFSKFTVSLTFRLASSRYDVSFTQKRKNSFKDITFPVTKSKIQMFWTKDFLMVHFQKPQFAAP